MKIPILVFLLLAFGSLAIGQKNFRIDRDSAGGIRLGMRVSQARHDLPECRFKRGSDGEGIALIDVSCRGKHVISLYAGEENVERKIDWNRRIEFIEVWDRRFKTADGVHPGMTIRKAEQILGKVREIEIIQIESREFVTFRKVRKGIVYRTYGGIYTRPNVTTTKYEPGSRLHSIQVSKAN